MAAIASPPPLLPVTRTLCRREPFAETADGLTLGQVPGRLALAVLVATGATLLGGVLPSRYASTSAEARWLGSLTMGVLLGGSYLYQYLWRPLFRRAPGYRLVGELVVREKFEVLGTRLLRVGPIGEQRVRVGDWLYGQLRVGDWVRVIYTAEGRLVSVVQCAEPDAH